MGGIRAVQIFLLWLRQRAFVQWLSSIGDAIAERPGLPRHRPAARARAARRALFRDQVWPIFLEVLTQPLLWLAVAALVYGSPVLSLAELWRRGQPYATRVPGASVFARYAERRALRQVGPRPRRTPGRCRTGRPSSATWTTSTCRLSTRCDWCCGRVLFLGSYILAYALVLIAQNYFETLLNWIVGGQGYVFWVRLEPAFAVLTEAPFETLRLCLLAVPFRRCLELFHQRVEAAAPRHPPGSRCRWERPDGAAALLTGPTPGGDRPGRPGRGGATAERGRRGELRDCPRRTGRARGPERGNGHRHRRPGGYFAEPRG